MGTKHNTRKVRKRRADAMDVELLINIVSAFTN